ncbi:MAG: error-prone DNA polymerase [Candidatus Sericytochromatia bacterium]|nr:error-prone DNA polymerase [Candidatus Sericytochromatia bacterium]
MAFPLWCKSNFSFLEGASHPEELVEAAARQGWSGLALTDRDGLYGVVKAHRRAQALGLRLCLGSTITLEDASPLVLLVQNRRGYANLCRLISAGRLAAPKGASQVRWDQLAAHAEGLIALWGGAGSRLLAAEPPEAEAAGLCEAFGDRLYAMYTRHLLPDDRAQEQRLRQRAARWGLPVVATCEVRYHEASRQPLQDVLTCIRTGLPLHRAGGRLAPNAEYALLSPDALAQRFSDDPAGLARSLEVAARCDFSLAELRYRYPSEQLPDGLSSFMHLCQLARAGARWRYGGEPPAEVEAQLARELALIEQLDYAGYFLTMHELVRFCAQRGILCQGRGSAANSVVCYCLGITAVDPIRMGLLFERFISAERAEPPDIDLDIEHERREEVIQHVYERYGRTHAAMVAVVIAYRPRSAIRDVGKALGLPETELGRVCKLLGYRGPIEQAVLQQAGLPAQHAVYRHLLTLSNALLGFPRHLSIHPGGFLLGHEPVNELVPVENATMEARTVIQWDKDDIEALGLFKVDLLGLGALSHLRRCFELLARHEGLYYTMATIPPEDPATYAMLGRADTVGVFQVESRAQMSMLPRLRPCTYYDLVIEISLVRPGPITGGMVHPYLRRRRGEEPVVYPHEALRPVLAKTLGVPLFQEQVMKLAMVAADYTPGEADQLRRDMAAWRKHGSMAHHYGRLIGRMVEKGIERPFAEQVFKQIEGFGEYGFPEAHAASFALITYMGAYLRCHHLPIFVCALLNSQPMGFYSPATILEDARRHGLTLLPIDVRASQWDCTLEALPASASPAADPLARWALRLGLRLVKGLSAAAAQRIVALMQPAGALRERPASLEAFIWESALDQGALAALAEAGAFDGFGLTRRQALWVVRGAARREPLPLGFQEASIPAFRQLSLFETVQWDTRRTGASARAHPLAVLRPELLAQGLPDARALSRQPSGARVRYVGLVICRQRPGTASGVVFLTLEDETGFVNLVVWPAVFERFKRLVKTVQCLGVSGTLQVQHGLVHLVAARFWEPVLAARLPRTASRDFH